MNDDELFEAELQRLKPARPPEEFVARIAASEPLPKAASVRRLEEPETGFDWMRLLRWLVPATVVAAGTAALLLWRPSPAVQQGSRDSAARSAEAAVKADDVDINHRLVASFDAVARLPDGAPIRLRCQEWADEVVLVDSAKGIVVEETRPRLEIVPVRFETY